MYKHKIQVRVRYSETDKMGVVYYGNYAQYFEVGRVELMRELGVVYKELEETGIMMPVVHYEVDFKFPAKYDELITVETSIEELPSSKMIFNHTIYNEEGKLVCTGKIILVFITMEFKPTRVPEDILNNLKRLGVK